MIKITLPDNIRGARNPETTVHETIDQAIEHLIAWNPRYAWETPTEREWAGFDNIPEELNRNVKALWCEGELVTADPVRAVLAAARDANDDPNAVVEIDGQQVR